MNAFSDQRAKRGFSAVELVTVIAIACILMAIAVPSFIGMLQSYRLTTATGALFSAVNLARSEAIHRGTRVDLVPAGDGRRWEDGWIVFVDENNNQRPDGNEKTIYSYPAVGDDVRITPTFTDSKVKYLAYNGTGRTRTNANSQTSQSGNWRLEVGRQSRKVVINFLGRARLCNPDKEPAC